MQLRRLICLFLGMMCVASFAAAEEVVPLALIHGTLIDGTGNAPISDAVLVIQGDRILAAGAADAVEIPANAKTIDVQGATIVSGVKDANAVQADNKEKAGTLKPGKIADLLVVNGNPLEDRSAMQNIKMVIHHGQIVENAPTAGAAYRDGTYEAQDTPDVEGYYAKAKITVTDGKITNVEWNIFDKHRNNRVFDETYEEVFTGNALYQEQCRKDLAGANIYGNKLVETQHLDNVDAISGATWAHKKFVNIMKSALEQAKP